MGKVFIHRTTSENCPKVKPHHFHAFPLFFVCFPRMAKRNDPTFLLGSGGIK